MSESARPLPLFSVNIRTEQDVVLARQRTRLLTARLGFDPLLQTQIATALSEIARNAYQYAQGGQVDFAVLTELPVAGKRLRQTLLIEVRDHGPGIANLKEIQAGTYRSSTGLGVGLAGSRRLMDRVEVSSTSQGTTVHLAKVLPPPAVPRTLAEIRQIVAELSSAKVTSPLEEVTAQNRELLHSIDEARAREDELGRLNQELAETNSGVLALYDELETLHRISVMLASKLELKPLIQAIIDVTTHLTDADLGAFFLRDEASGEWRLLATAGRKADALGEWAAPSAGDFFTEEFGRQGLVYSPDVTAELASAGGSAFLRALARRVAVHSCLAVAVQGANEHLNGALVFASAQPRAFSERSERILRSIAAQARVGIEKARAFQTVTAANEAKDRFFATLSHELRTPLNPALAIVSSLLEDPRLPPELREDIAIVWRNIRLEARLIDDLLDFNRLIKGKFQLATEPVEVHALIAGVVEVCREDLSARHHRLTLDLAAPESHVLGDSARLQQVLWNVLKNAIKFTPEQGAILIRTSSREGELQVAVIDTGRGIEPAAIERIFSAFEQGQAPVIAAAGGLGLGLSIARMFVELHGGSIRAASPGLGQGATVTIRLPLTERPQPLPALDWHPPAPVASSGQTARLLLVDDHPDTLRGLSRLLERRGYSVATANSGAEALAALRRESFDLLISDIGLPDGSGLLLLAKARQIQPMPAIALSGYGMEADLAGSREAGFDAHLTKPVDFALLHQQVEKLLR